MTKTLYLVFLLSMGSLTTFSQENVKNMTVVSYNVENLFDTLDSPGFDDADFTPSGRKNWTGNRYQKKVTDLARVISSIPGEDLPALIGLAEIENRTVLEDLLEEPGLHGRNYQIIHEDGVDPRGIECAMLYRPDLFTYFSHQYIPIEDPGDPDYLYRAILYVKGTGPDGASLHLFMNHWKSRSGGAEITERQRMASALSLRKQLDLLNDKETDPRVIIMGDFNDEPTNQTMIYGLRALNKRQNPYPGEYFNLLYDKHNLNREGTYNYQGTWNMLDQLIISYSLLNQEEGLSTGFDQGNIFREDWMMYDNEKYEEKLPSSTFGGPNYYGGPSDHLPIYVKFSW